MTSKSDVDKFFEEASNFSESRIGDIRGFYRGKVAGDVVNSSVFITGSFGRKEARKASDLDIFFTGEGSSLKEESYLRWASFEMQNSLHFPEFDKGGTVLKLHDIRDMKAKIGSPDDDYQNHFTARMLMLLESQYLFNESKYNNAKDSIIREYFRDDEHGRDFRPAFLLNDIARYWRTICLNYEYSRGKYLGDQEKTPSEKAKLKLKNKKLKFNRIWLCYSGIVPLVAKSYWKVDEAIELFAKSPSQRLKDVCEKGGRSELYYSLAGSYVSFLETVAASEKDLLSTPESATWSTLDSYAVEIRTHIIEIIKNCSKESDWSYLLV